MMSGISAGSGLASSWGVQNLRATVHVASSSSSTASEESESVQRPQGPPPGPPPEFQIHMSTTQFASGSLSEALSSLDEDEDGSISSEEFGLDEASDQVQAFFEAADTDDDGSLSTEELDAVQQALAEQMQQAMGGPRGPGGPGGPPPGPPPEEEMEDALSALDTNGDGVVSAEEYGLDSATDEVQQLFAAIDTDGDENLSAEEVSSFKETMAAEMQAQGMPPGPPPPRPQDASSTTSTDSADVQAVLQRLAEGYLSLMAGSEGSTSSSTFSTLA